MKPQSETIKAYIIKEQKLYLKHELKKFTIGDHNKFFDEYVDFKIKNQKVRESLKTELKNYPFIDESTPFESAEHRRILNLAKDFFIKVNPEFTEEKLPHLATLYSFDICAEVSMETEEPVMFFYGELFMANLLFAKIFALSIPYEFDANTQLNFKFDRASVKAQAYTHVDKILDLFYNTINNKPHDSSSYLIKDDITESIAYQIIESILLFIFAHEVGHLELDHDFESEEKETNWREEYEADIYAADNLIRNFKREDNGYPMCLMGPFVFFHYLAILESESDSKGDSNSHPPAMQRLNKYLFYLRSKIDEPEMNIVDEHVFGFRNIFETFIPFLNNSEIQ